MWTVQTGSRLAFSARCLSSKVPPIRTSRLSIKRDDDVGDGVREGVHPTAVGAGLRPFFRIARLTHSTWRFRTGCPRLQRPTPYHRERAFLRGKVDGSVESGRRSSGGVLLGCEEFEARAYLQEVVDCDLVVGTHHLPSQLQEREFLIDNLLVRIHYIIVMITWTGFAPWEFEFPFPCSSHLPSRLQYGLDRGLTR